MPHSGVRVRLCERAPCAQVTRMRTGVVPARQFRGQVQGSPWHRRSRTLEPSAALARGSVLPPSSSLAGLAMPPHPWPVPPATGSRPPPALHRSRCGQLPHAAPTLMLQGAWDTGLGGGGGVTGRPHNLCILIAQHPGHCWRQGGGRGADLGSISGFFGGL